MIFFPLKCVDSGAIKDNIKKKVFNKKIKDKITY